MNNQIGSLAADSTLHPFGASSLGRPADCATLDRNARLFTNVRVGQLGASAALTQHCVPIGSEPETTAQRPCPADSARDLFYGTLGPQAESVSYSTPQGIKNVPTVGPEGAYLIVLPSSAASSPSTSSGLYPSAPITEIRFRGGNRCAIKDIGPVAGEANCQIPGYAATATALPTQADLATPIRTQVKRRGHGWVITVRFRARIPVDNAGTTYNIRTVSPGATRGQGATRVINRNVKRDSIIVERFVHSRPGIYRGTVSFHNARGPGSISLGAGGVLVGRFHGRVPAGHPH